MLEILRHAFTRIEAVILLRSLNKKFLSMSEDTYLDNFCGSTDTMFLDVRKQEDLVYLSKMIRYANLIKGKNCLHIDFFWIFKRGLSPDEERSKCVEIVDLLLQARSFKKLTIGSDGVWSCYLPKVFVELFLQELSVREVQI